MKPWLLKKEEGKFVEVMGAKIYLKPLKYGKAREALGASISVSPAGRTTVDSGLMATLRTLYQIKDWELTDENDNKLPITLETFDEVLGEDFVTELVQAVNDKTAGEASLPEAEKK